MMKSQNQTSQDQQLSNQQPQFTKQEQLMSVEDNFDSEEQQNSDQEQTKGCLDDYVAPPKDKIQNKSKITLKCIYYVLIFLLIAYLGLQFMVEIQIKAQNQQRYKDNLKKVDQMQTNIQTYSFITLPDNGMGQAAEMQNNQNKQMKQQNNNNQQQIFPRANQYFISDQPQQFPQKTDLVSSNMYYSEGNQSKKPTKIQDNGIKPATFQEMYQQFLKNQQKLSIQPTQSLPNQLHINPTIYPFNKNFSNDRIQQQYGTFVAISGEAISKAKTWRQLTKNNIEIQDPLNVEQKNYYEQRYMISKYEQLPFCIVVPTFNNAEDNRYYRNIQSIIMQNYNNYRIVIIDDASQDNTGQLIQSYLKSKHKFSSDKYQIIRNTIKLNAMPNLRNAAKNYCKPQEIFLIVDGDDELVGRQVLKLFNAVFQQKKLWFVYSNFLISGKKIGYSRPFPKNTIKRNSYRTYPFITSHLRAFYTKLFLNIKQQDIRDLNGNYFKSANDVAICLPILEQSQERIGYLPEITYYFHSNTGLNNHQLRFTEQRTNQRQIRKKHPYKRLQKLMD